MFTRRQFPSTPSTSSTILPEPLVVGSWHDLKEMVDPFNFPWQYSFPPFFTLQPHEETRKKQIESWKSLILDYCQSGGIQTLDISSIQSTSLFHNKEIGRKLSENSIREICKELEKSGNLEWISKTGVGKNGVNNKCLIYWRSPAQWADLIYNYVRQNGLNRGSVCTFYELTEGDEVSNQPFYNLEKQLLIKSLEVLAKEEKAEIFANDQGVKFF